MTIATFLVPSICDSSTSTVATQTVFGLSRLILTDVKASSGNDEANLSQRISWSSFADVFLPTLRFLANPPRYFSCLFSSSTRNVVLLP